MNNKLILILVMLSLVLTSVYAQACVISNVQTFDNKFKDDYLTQVLEKNQKKVSSDNLAKLRTALLKTIFNDYYNQDPEKKGWTDTLLENGQTIIGLERLLNVIINYDVVFVYEFWQDLAAEMVRIQKTTGSLAPSQFLRNNIRELQKDLELDESKELTDKLNQLEKLLDMFDDEELVWEETQVTQEREIESETSLESIIGTELNRVELNSKEKGYKTGNLEKISERDEGVYGEVFKVEYEGKIYALKLLKAPQPKSIASLKREFEVARRTIDLESTVEFYKYVTEEINDETVIVGVLEDYVEGDNVRKAATNPEYKIPAESYDLAWNDLLTMINRGILSTDVKANNVMVTKDGKIKIMDYGVAQFLDVGSLDEVPFPEESFAKMAISELENMYQQLSILQQRHAQLNNRQELIKAIQQVLSRSKDVLDFMESKRTLLGDSWINTKKKAFLDNEEIIALSILFNTVKDKLKISREQFDQLVNQVRTAPIETLEEKISTEELNQLQDLFNEASDLRKAEFLKGKPASKLVREKLIELQNSLKKLVSEGKLTPIESSQWATKIDGLDRSLIEEYINTLIEQNDFEGAEYAVNAFGNSGLLQAKEVNEWFEKLESAKSKAEKETLLKEAKPRIQAKPGTINNQGIKLEEGKSVIIGRDGDWKTDKNNQHVSARHAKIQIYNGKLIITDLDSTNGVFINGKKEQPNQQRILIEGDKISLGIPTSKNKVELKVTYKKSNFDCKSGSASCTIPFKVQNQDQAIQELESKKEILLQNLPEGTTLTVTLEGIDELTLHFEGSNLPSLTTFNNLLNNLFDPVQGNRQLLNFAETYKVQEETNFEDVITELQAAKFEGCNGGICYISNIDASKIVNQLEQKREKLIELITASGLTMLKGANPVIIFGIGQSVTIRVNTAEKSVEIDQQIERIIRPLLEETIPELKKEEELEEISETQRELYDLIKESIILDKLSKAQELLDDAVLEESLPETHIKQLINLMEGKENLDKLFIQIDYKEQELKRDVLTQPQISIWQRLKSSFSNQAKQEISELDRKKQELEQTLQETTKEKQTLQKLLEKTKYQVLRRDDVRNSLNSLRTAYEKEFISEKTYLNIFNELTFLLTAKPSEFETLPTNKVIATIAIPKLFQDYSKEYDELPTAQNKAKIKQEFENYLQTLISTSHYTEENNCSACEWRNVKDLTGLSVEEINDKISEMQKWLSDKVGSVVVKYDSVSDVLTADSVTGDELVREKLHELQDEFETLFLPEKIDEELNLINSYYEKISMLFVEISELNSNILFKQRDLNDLTEKGFLANFLNWLTRKKINLEKELNNLKQDLSNKQQELEQVKAEARTQNAVIAINLALMNSKVQGGMQSLLAGESMGGNAGMYGRYPALGANFVFDSKLGEFVYFENPQHVPNDVKGDSGGTLRFISSEEGIRIIEVYGLEGEALQKAQKIIDYYNERFGFEIKDMTLDEVKNIYQLKLYILDLFREKKEIILDEKTFTQEQLLNQLSKAQKKNNPLALTRSGGLREKFEEIKKQKYSPCSSCVLSVAGFALRSVKSEDDASKIIIATTSREGYINLGMIDAKGYQRAIDGEEPVNKDLLMKHFFASGAPPVGMNVYVEEKYFEERVKPNVQSAYEIILEHVRIGKEPQNVADSFKESAEKLGIKVAEEKSVEVIPFEELKSLYKINLKQTLKEFLSPEFEEINVLVEIIGQALYVKVEGIRNGEKVQIASLNRIFSIENEVLTEIYLSTITAGIDRPGLGSKIYDIEREIFRNLNLDVKVTSTVTNPKTAYLQMKNYGSTININKNLHELRGYEQDPLKLINDLSDGKGGDLNAGTEGFVFPERHLDEIIANMKKAGYTDELIQKSLSLAGLQEKISLEQRVEREFDETTPLEQIIGKEGISKIFEKEETNFEVTREDGAKITLNYLASGAFGSTFKLTTPEGVFALKIYDGMEGDPEQEWEGVQQADSLEEIAHGLTKTTNEHGRVVGILQEYIPGSTLKELLNENVLFSDETIAEMRSIPAKLRKVGVVHRDLYQGTLLKPDNVKITPEGKVKVLDFGVSETWTDWSINVPFSQFNEETFYDEYGIYHFITQMIPRRKTLHETTNFEQELENTIKELKMYNNEMLDRAEIAKKLFFYAKENVEQAYKDALKELNNLAEQKKVDFEKIKKIAEQKANKERPVRQKRNLTQLIMDLLGIKRAKEEPKADFKKTNKS